jgi:hypothetical protein
MLGYTDLKWDFMVEVCRILSEETSLEEKDLLLGLINHLQGWGK